MCTQRRRGDAAQRDSAPAARSSRWSVHRGGDLGEVRHQRDDRHDRHSFRVASNTMHQYRQQGSTVAPVPITLLTVSGKDEADKTGRGRSSASCSESARYLLTCASRSGPTSVEAEAQPISSRPHSSPGQSAGRSIQQRCCRGAFQNEQMQWAPCSIPLPGGSAKAEPHWDDGTVRTPSTVQVRG